MDRLCRPEARRETEIRRWPVSSAASSVPTRHHLPPGPSRSPADPLTLGSRTPARRSQAASKPRCTSPSPSRTGPAAAAGAGTTARCRSLAGPESQPRRWRRSRRRRSPRGSGGVPPGLARGIFAEQARARSEEAQEGRRNALLAEREESYVTFMRLAWQYSHADEKVMFAGAKMRNAQTEDASAEQYYADEQSAAYRELEQLLPELLHAHERVFDWLASLTSTAPTGDETIEQRPHAGIRPGRGSARCSTWLTHETKIASSSISDTRKDISTHPSCGVSAFPVHFA